MATASGSTISYGLFAYTEYTITHTATQTKLTVSKAVTRTNTSNVGINNISGTYSGTGQTTKTVSGKNMRSSADVTMFSSFTWTWDKGTSAASKTIKFSITFSGGGTSTAQYTVTVPALDKVVLNYNANGGTIPDSPHQTGSYYYKLSSSVVQRSTSSSSGFANINQTVYYNDTINLYNIATPNLAKTGYHTETATAWRQASATGTVRSEATDFSWSTFGSHNTNYSSQKTTNITFYANWIANTYTVTYNGNGSTGGSTADSSHTYGTSSALTANGYTKSGYAFAGWNTSADGSGTSYTDGQSVLNLTTANGGTVTLYAQWTKNATTVKVKVNGVWKDGEVFVKINGTWKAADTGYVKINGSWVEFS